MKRTKTERGDFLENNRMFREGNYKMGAEETLSSEVSYNQQGIHGKAEGKWRGNKNRRSPCVMQRKTRRSGWAFVVSGSPKGAFSIHLSPEFSSYICNHLDTHPRHVLQNQKCNVFFFKANPFLTFWSLPMALTLYYSLQYLTVLLVGNWIRKTLSLCNILYHLCLTFFCYWSHLRFD